MQNPTYIKKMNYHTKFVKDKNKKRFFFIDINFQNNFWEVRAEIVKDFRNILLNKQ